MAIEKAVPKQAEQYSSASTWLGVAGLCAATVFAARKFLRTPPKHFDLRGKVALITGGSRGLGLALARELGSRGARLALCARGAQELDRACALLKESGIEAHSFPVDITKATELPDLARRIASQLGSIDVLINNAGRITVGSFDSLTKEDYEAAMDLMFWAPVNLTHAVLPLMRSKASGNIVNITSVGGRVSVPHLLPYSCAKFAFVGFSTGLTVELKKKGIDVLTVVPGLMRTGSYLNAEFKGAAKKEFAWFGLLGNLPGFSVAAGRAAKEICNAMMEGKDVWTISVPAKVLVALEALAPEVNRTVFETVNRFALPESEAKDSVPGKHLNPSLNLLFQGLTTLGRLAAQQYNE